jgi:hypothetical protein
MSIERFENFFQINLNKGPVYVEKEQRFFETE